MKSEKIELKEIPSKSFITESQASGYILKYFLISRQRLIENIKTDVLKSVNINQSEIHADYIAEELYKTLEDQLNKININPPEPAHNPKRRWSA